jgi:hypothetical protein
VAIGLAKINELDVLFLHLVQVVRGIGDDVRFDAEWFVFLERSLLSKWTMSFLSYVLPRCGGIQDGCHGMIKVEIPVRLPSQSRGWGWGMIPRR